MTESSGTFNLETAINTWRHVLRNERAVLEEDLEELEQHVREQVAAQVQEGQSEELAFRTSMQEMGTIHVLQGAYRQVYWTKARSRGMIAGETRWHLGLLQSQVRLMWRQLLRHPTYSLINMAGLASGLTATLLIVLFIQHERSYDRFHTNADRMYRVVREDSVTAYLGTSRFAVTPVPLVSALEMDVPGVDRATQLSPVSALFKNGSTTLQLEGLLATASFFDVFSFSVLEGSPSEALARPNTVVLTRSVAERLFPGVSPVGRTVEGRWERTTRMLEVTGVVEDPPTTTHVSFAFLISMQSDEFWVDGQEEWDNNDRYTYFLAVPGADMRGLELRIASLAKQHLENLAWYRERPERMTRYAIEPVTSIHLHSGSNFELGSHGDIRNVRLFAAVAAFILLIACINYMNLATARTASRCLETGIRQASGARRGQLLQQFMGESVIITVMSMVLAMVAVWISLPAFSSLVGRDLAPSGMWNVPFVAGAGGLILLVSLLSGGYPAWMLSGLRTVDALKGNRLLGRGSASLRNVLVVAQYATGIALIAASLVMRDQVTYMSASDTGLDRDQVLSVHIRDSAMRGSFTTLLERLDQVPGVAGVAAATARPIHIDTQSGTRRFEGNTDNRELPAFNIGVSHDFIGVMGLEIVEGRTFSRDREEDAGQGLIINERARDLAGWDEATGKSLEYGFRGSEVVGVVRNFQFHSMRQVMEPLIMYLAPERVEHVLVKIPPGNVSGVVDDIKQVVASFSPDYPFEYVFLDDAYQALYAREYQVARILNMFTALALIIACLGLFALSAYTAEKRRREIGIRKVLGASSSAIVFRLSREFMALVLLAMVIALPVAWMMMSRWLQGYAFRVDIQASTLLLAGLSALLVAWGTVAFHAVAAARTNPADVLRENQ